MDGDLIPRFDGRLSIQHRIIDIENSPQLSYITCSHSITFRNIKPMLTSSVSRCSVSSEPLFVARKREKSHRSLHTR